MQLRALFVTTAIAAACAAADDEQTSLAATSSEGGATTSTSSPASDDDGTSVASDHGSTASSEGADATSVASDDDASSSDGGVETGEPFDDSPLSLAAAALAPDAFGTFTMGGTPQISMQPGASIMEYVSRALWDPQHARIRFVGVSHVGGWAQYAEYELPSDAWAQELVPDGRDDPRHGYSGTACDAASGTTFYHEGNGGDRLWTRSASGEWIERTNPQPGWANVEWHPDLGVLVIGQVWGIRTFDPASETFDVLHDNPAGTEMADSAGASAWSGKDRSVYVGNYGDDGAIWRIDADAIATRIANPPVPVAVHDAWNNAAMLIGAASPAHRLLAIRQNAELYEYDEVADAWSGALDGFTGQPEFVEFIGGATNKQWIAVSLPELGVIAFMRQVGDEMDATMMLWKH
ncbi:MAG TPA: hypothetical protein VG755_19015 [Nannocystaceae bacterium]|nr:hypothetical protein [Nannocystaceae bacterium]